MAQWQIQNLISKEWKQVEAASEEEAIARTGWDERTTFAVRLGQGQINKSPRWMSDRRKSICPLCRQRWTLHAEDGACPETEAEDGVDYGKLFGWRK